MITGGLPPIPGNSIVEKMRFFQENLDYIRTSIICEPRGHRDMVGAVLVPPTRKDADFGVFYLDSEGCHSMCGHGSIGVCTSLVKMGWISCSEPETEVILETPAGLVSVRVCTEKGGITSANLINVPSFLYAGNIAVFLNNLEVKVDIAFGGNFYALVDTRSIGIDLIPENIPELIQVAKHIADEVNHKIQVTHPEEKHIKNERFVYFYGSPDNPKVDARSLAVGGRGNFDRSPCGTGTSARMAALHAKGLLKSGDSYSVESMTGTQLIGKVLKVLNVGKFKAILPQITASAYITGFHQFIIEPSDPLMKGFVS
jgi:proline racemase